jgi:hypothetical protein
MWFMNLRQYILEAKLTQAEFGQMLQPPVSQGKVNHWLHGTRRVSLAEAIQIQRVTGDKVTVFDLAKQRVSAEQGAA